MIHAVGGGASSAACGRARLCYHARMSEPTSFLFSGYARLPQDVSHQAMYKRVGVVIEVDGDGLVTACSTTLMMQAASRFFERLLIGRNVLTERREIEALVRYRYRGHSQGALVSALHKAFEAVDQSPLVLGEAAGHLPSARPDGTAQERG
jgi:Domain of unknown function (DUF3870)